MTVLENNLNILHELYMSNMSSMNGLTSEGPFLVCGGEKVDISRCDISALYTPGNPFSASIEQLTATDVFKIIRLISFSTDVQMRANALATMKRDTPEAEKAYNEIKQQQAVMTLDEFYGAINSPVPIEGQTKENVGAWYRFLGDLVMYEDFVTPEAKGMLSRFRNYVISLQLSDDEELNPNQLEARDQLAKFQQEKDEKQIGKDGKQKEKGHQYVFRKDAAFIAHAEVIILILAMALVLTAVAIYVIN